MLIGACGLSGSEGSLGLILTSLWLVRHTVQPGGNHASGVHHLNPTGLCGLVRGGFEANIKAEYRASRVWKFASLIGGRV